MGLISEQTSKTKNAEQTEQTTRVVHGVIARKRGASIKLTDIHVPSPGPNGVIVDIQTCDVCHTDLAYRDGDIADEYPFFLGHETVGMVSEIGKEVTHVTVGDFVVLNWRAVCGECRACERGESRYCFSAFNASKPMTLTDGIVLTPALGIGAFAGAILIHKGQCAKVDSAADPAATGLLGCGIMAGISMTINTGEVKRDESVIVIDCGNVDTATIVDVKLAGASKVITIDISDEKLDTAHGFGTTETINSAELAKSNKGIGEEDPVVKRVRGLTDGFGADTVIDVVGRPGTYRQMFYAHDLARRVVLIDVPAPTMKLDIPLTDMFNRGGVLESSWYDDCLPERSFSTLMGLSLQNRLPLEDFVTERTDIEDVDEAFEAMKAGKILRSVVILWTRI